MYLDDLVTEFGSEGRKRRQEELDLHKTVATFFKWAMPADCAWTHFPAGGKRSKKTGGELSAMGLKSGWPDFQFVWRGRGLFMELKAPGGTLSADQRQTHTKLRLAGGEVVICRTPEEARDAVLAWGIRLDPKVKLS